MLASDLLSYLHLPLQSDHQGLNLAQYPSKIQHSIAPISAWSNHSLALGWKNGSNLHQKKKREHQCVKWMNPPGRITKNHFCTSFLPSSPVPFGCYTKNVSLTLGINGRYNIYTVINGKLGPQSQSWNALESGLRLWVWKINGRQFQRISSKGLLHPGVRRYCLPLFTLGKIKRMKPPSIISVFAWLKTNICSRETDRRCVHSFSPLTG